MRGTTRTRKSRVIRSWTSPDDVNIRVLKARPIEAEFWDGSGTVVSLVKMMMATATGTLPDMGDNREVELGAR